MSLKEALEIPELDLEDLEGMVIEGLPFPMTINLFNYFAAGSLGARTITKAIDLSIAEEHQLVPAIVGHQVVYQESGQNLIMPLAVASKGNYYFDIYVTDDEPSDGIISHPDEEAIKVAGVDDDRLEYADTDSPKAILHWHADRTCNSAANISSSQRDSELPAVYKQTPKLVKDKKFYVTLRSYLSAAWSSATFFKADLTLNIEFYSLKQSQYLKTLEESSSGR